jgi:hypothetical protein
MATAAVATAAAEATAGRRPLTLNPDG